MRSLLVLAVLGLIMAGAVFGVEVTNKVRGAQVPGVSALAQPLILLTSASSPHTHTPTPDWQRRHAQDFHRRQRGQCVLLVLQGDAEHVQNCIDEVKKFLFELEEEKIIEIE